MKINIDYENTFLKELSTGINLFTGAGFSVLPGPDGKSLPTGAMLSTEICNLYGFPQMNDLEMISMRANNIDSKKLDSYLRGKFRVDSYNPLYNTLKKIKINNYITTNIDNLFQTIIESDNDKYINNAVNGSPRNHGVAVNYIPLHGDITDENSRLYFGKFELNMAAAQNNNMFTLMCGELQKYPTLFWGYGFHDSSVMTNISKLLIEQKSNIWLQFQKSEEEMAKTYHELGFNTILADTDELLEYINSNLSTPDCDSSDGKISNLWNEYKIPTQNKLKINVREEDYYNNGDLEWNVIYSAYPCLTEQYAKTKDKSFTCKNLIIVGSPQCGKSTLLMQLALKYEEITFFIKTLTESEALKLVKDVREKITVFVDDCALDMRAYRILAENKNIHLVGASDQYSYESSKHILEGIDYQVIQFDDIDEKNARTIFNNIPQFIRNDSFKYSGKAEDKYSFLEFGIDNIRNILTEEKIVKFINSIDDIHVREIVFLTTFLTHNKSMLSTDVLFYYLAGSYNEIKDTIRRVNEALASVNEKISQDMIDEDYYILRSSLFLKYMHDIALNRFKNEYGNVIRKMIERVPRGVIYRYYVYHRTAYDAEFFYNLFGKNARSVYDLIYRFDDSGYTLQQMALYESRCRNYPEAFRLIEKAGMMLPNNFSIQNAKAIITFEANKLSNTDIASKQRDQAMQILTKCYESDKRKTYHAQKFAEFAIFISDNYQDDQYIETAKKWILEVVNQNGIITQKTKRLMRQLEIDVHNFRDK